MSQPKAKNKPETTIQPMETLVHSFTRDLSLCVTQWWTEVQRESYEKELGMGYSDNPAASANGSVAFFYLQSDLDAIRRAFLDKLQSDPQFYLSRRADYLDAVRRLRAIKAEKSLPTPLASANLEPLKAIFHRLYPMYRFAIFIPSIWKDDVERVLGQDTGAITIAAAFEDRIRTEGALEELDSVFRKLVGQKLSQMGQPTSLSKWLSQDEVDQLAQNKSVNWTEVSARKSGFVYCEGKVYATTDFQPIFKNASYQFTEEKTSGSILKGNVAFRKGQAQGRVRRVFTAEQAHDFAEGDILVAPMTSPDFLSAMKRAAAIVTDEGGITCHAAIVSRELQKPCIVGTKSATRLFQDGDFIQVDTHAGTVTKLPNQ